jgi:hypothetical protein
MSAQTAAEAERERRKQVAIAKAAEKKRQEALQKAAIAAKTVLDNTPARSGDKGGDYAVAAVNAGRAYAALGLPGPGNFDYRDSPATKFANSSKRGTSIKKSTSKKNKRRSLKK